MCLKLKLRQRLESLQIKNWLLRCLLECQSHEDFLMIPFFWGRVFCGGGGGGGEGTTGGTTQGFLKHVLAERGGL